MLELFLKLQAATVSHLCCSKPKENLIGAYTEACTNFRRSSGAKGYIGDHESADHQREGCFLGVSSSSMSFTVIIVIPVIMVMIP